jgi:hypothetical protein
MNDTVIPCPPVLGKGEGKAEAWASIYWQPGPCPALCQTPISHLWQLQARHRLPPSWEKRCVHGSPSTSKPDRCPGPSDVFSLPGQNESKCYHLVSWSAVPLPDTDPHQQGLVKVQTDVSLLFKCWGMEQAEKYHHECVLLTAPWEKDTGSCGE